MKTIRIATAIGALCLPLAALATPAAAATAHNSQAGGMGSSTNASAPTGMHKRAKPMKHRMKHM